MTEKSSPENQNPLREDSRTASSGNKGTRKKSGRVSQRRELAIVTLGAVAAITGLGGVLAANPPSWAISAANAQQAATIQKVATPTKSTSAGNNATRPASDTERDQDETAQVSAQQQANRRAARQASRQAARQAAQQSTPVYSAPAQTPSGAVSQGS